MAELTDAGVAEYMAPTGYSNMRLDCPTCGSSAHPSCGAVDAARHHLDDLTAAADALREWARGGGTYRRTTIEDTVLAAWSPESMRAAATWLELSAGWARVQGGAMRDHTYQAVTFARTLLGKEAL